MRHILQGFTMHSDGIDYGIDTDEVTLPIPTPKTQEYQGGGQDLAVDQPMMALEALEVTVKMAGHNPDIMAMFGRAPGRLQRIAFRGAVLSEMSGSYVPHVCIVEGAVNGGSRDAWQRGEKSGLEFLMNGIIYFRYDINDRAIHEIQAWPPKRIVNGIDQLSEVNAVLGYAT